ncbi:MAG: hypothetical protein IKX54_00600 [Lachnospiraceae bacterium]|nr:hypothetical protein [Lachnospiraceae bacterium]
MSDKKQNYSIAGSGSLPGADYNGDIRISGSGRINGSAICDSFSIAGSGHVHGGLTCRESFHAGGSGHVDEDLTAESFSASGSVTVGGNAGIHGECSCSGSAKFGSLQCGELRVGGSLRSEGNISAENARIRGAVTCHGLINAETLDVEIGGDCYADCIGGSSITIKRGTSAVGFFSKLFGHAAGYTFNVTNSIEGDEIYLENVTAASVTGRIVKIGDNCKIGYVSYTEGIEISENSHVDRYEIIG